MEKYYQKLLDTFLELVKIDSESYSERKMADYICRRLGRIGWSCEEDAAGDAIGGSAGNVYAYRNDTRSPKGLVMIAHMDRVKPGNGVNPSVVDGIISSDGNTVLGADDAVGLAVMLALADYLFENNIFAPLELIFTVAEEVGIKGAKHFDAGKLVAKQGFTFDADGDIGDAVTAAPTHVQFLAKITGRAAHAGIAPENGVSAIKIVSHAIAGMNLGRISENTTSNMGTVVGGVATNIIPANVEIKGEVRSHLLTELEENLEHIEEQLKNACARFKGEYTMEKETAYHAFSMEDDAPVVLLFQKACFEEDIPFKTTKSGGGSDANVFNANGLQILNLGSAFKNIHSVAEKLAVADLNNLFRLGLRLVQLVASEKI